MTRRILCCLNFTFFFSIANLEATHQILVFHFFSVDIVKKNPTVSEQSLKNKQINLFSGIKDIMGKMFLKSTIENVPKVIL